MLVGVIVAFQLASQAIGAPNTPPSAVSGRCTPTLPYLRWSATVFLWAFTTRYSGYVKPGCILVRQKITSKNIFLLPFTSNEMNHPDK